MATRDTTVPVCRRRVENINKEIYPALEGMNGLNQRKIDSKMIAIDGTENKKKLGANAILAVSMANMKLVPRL